MRASARYHELLTADAMAEANRIVASDPLTREVTVTTASLADSLCTTLGLPPRLDAATTDTSNATPAPPFPRAGTQSGAVADAAPGGKASLPALPFSAPFTPLVPALLKVVRGYVQDSAAYLRNLIPPWDLEDALIQVSTKVLLRYMGRLCHTTKLAVLRQDALSMMVPLAVNVV